MGEVTHAYVARKPCGHVCYVAVDDGDSSLGKDLGKLIADRRTIERVTLADARGLDWTCTCPVTPEEQKIRDREARARARHEKRYGRRG